MCLKSYEDRTASKFYLNGFSRFGPAARSFAVIASLSSRVAEVFQSELMEDPRVAATYGTLLRVAAQELKWVVDLPSHVWSAMSSVVGCSAESLKDDAIAAAHVSFHFIWRRVLQPASELPWRLVRGDIRENLKLLRSSEHPPVEPCSGNLWRLMNEHDFAVDQLTGLVELLGQCSWSSLPAEQQHGSLAALHRWHPDYELNSLVSRSLLHQMVKLLPSVSDADKQISRIARQMRKLENKAPERAGPQHMLLKAIMAVARGRKEHPFSI